MFKIFKISGNPDGFEDLDMFHKLAQQFLPHAQQKLGFDKPVHVNLVSDRENAKDPVGKTAYYDPNQMKITLFVDKRHVKDILRSLSHELVHHTQNCRGDFDKKINTGAGYAQEDDHMRKMEAEAYLEGSGFLLRDWEDSLKKENKTMNEGKNTNNSEVQEEGAFAPNHYCVHHGGVQMEGEIKLGKVISHNWNEKLQKVTKYDMQFEDGTIVEGVAAEGILATEASLAEGHPGHMAKRDEDVVEEDELTASERAVAAVEDVWTPEAEAKLAAFMDNPATPEEQREMAKNAVEEVMNQLTGLEGFLDDSGFVDASMVTMPAEEVPAEKVPAGEVPAEVPDIRTMKSVREDKIPYVSKADLKKKADEKAAALKKVAKEKAAREHDPEKSKKILRDLEKTLKGLKDYIPEGVLDEQESAEPVKENWFKGNKDQLLFERLMEKWTK